MQLSVDSRHPIWGSNYDRGPIRGFKMRLYPETRVKVERDRFVDGEWSVLMANDPYNSWLNVPATFASLDAAQRVAHALTREVAELTGRGQSE